MGIDKNEWGFRVGHLPHGERNKISDVPGVTVGHCTLADGDIQTGVTALLPHPGDVFHDKVLAACHVINGFGKTTGLVQIDELGTLETPILFTNTLSVGTVETALVKYMLERNPDICETTGSVNPVVCECNDCGRTISGACMSPRRMLLPLWQTAKPISPRVQWVPDAECAATG